MASAPDPLSDLLRPDRLTAVVDVGANPVDGAPPYKPLLDAGLCSVTGFEPHPEALAALNAHPGAAERYLPYVVGDGGPGLLRICQVPSMTSLLRPGGDGMQIFRGFAQWGQVVKEVPVETRRLDDIAEIDHLDFLKIDVQGGELAVFRNGTRRLANAVAIQTEISFVPLYEGQPTFAEIDSELRAQDFVPHCFQAIKRWMISPMFDEKNHSAAINQLLEADIVYVRNFAKPERMQDEQLKHLAIIAHHCYRSFDLAANCLHHLMTRGTAAPDSLSRYVSQLKG